MNLPILLATLNGQAWPTFAGVLDVMGLASLLVAVKCCYPKDSWRLALILALVAAAMNLLAGYQTGAWAMRMETRMLALEKSNSIPNNPETRQQEK